MKPSDCIAIIKDATIYITEHKEHYLDIFILYAEVHSTQDSLSDVAKNYSDLFTQIFVQMQFLARHQKIDDILLKKNIQKMQLILENIPKTIKLSKHQKLDIVSGIVYLKSFIKILTCDVFSDLLKSTSSMNSFHSSTQESNVSDIDILSYNDTKSLLSASKLSGTVNSKSSKTSSLVLTGGMANNISDSSEHNNVPNMTSISAKHTTIVSSDNYGELTKLTNKYRNDADNEYEYVSKSKYNIRDDINTNFSEDNPFTSLNYTNDNPDDHIRKHQEKRNKNKHLNESTTKITELKTNDSLYDNENNESRDKYSKFDKDKYNKSKNKHIIERIDECDENSSSHSSYSSQSCSDEHLESSPKKHKHHKHHESSPIEHKRHKQRDVKTQTTQIKEHNAKTQTTQIKEHNATTQTKYVESSSFSSSSSEEQHHRRKHKHKHHHVICDVSGNVLNGGGATTTTINNTTNNNNSNNNSGGTSTSNTTNNTSTTDTSGYSPIILTGTGNATLVVNTTTISIDQILKIYSLKILKQIEAIEFVITSTIKILSEIKRDFLAKINCLEMYSTTSNLDLAEVEYHNNLLNTLYNQLSVILLQTDSDGNPIFNNMNQTITITLNLGSGGTYQLFTIDNIYAMYLSTQMDIIVGSGDYTFLLFQNNITVLNAITIYKASFLNVKNAIFALNANKKILCQWKDMITMKCF